MAKGNRIGVKGSNRRRIQQSEQNSEESDEEYKVTDDEECDESDEYCSLDGEESEEILAAFEETGGVARSRNTRRTSGRNGSEIKKPRKKRRFFYAEDDDDEEEEEVDDEDDAEFTSLGRKAYQIKRPHEKKRVLYTEVDDEEEEEEDSAEFVSSGRKGNPIKKAQEKSRVSYTDENDDEDEDDEDDEEFMSYGRKGNQKKNLREKRKVVYTEDDNEDGSEFKSSSRKGYQIKKVREKRTVSHKEEDEEEVDEDDEYMSYGRKGNQKKKLREKRKVVYTEDDDEDDSEFTSSSRKGNQIKEPRDKKMVSHNEEDEDEEDEDENDEEFMLSESDFFDDEDESPKIKKNEKISRYHPQKKSVGGGRKKKRKSKILKNPTRPKQRNHKFSRKLDSSKERPITNKTQMEKERKKSSRRRKRRVVPQSDSDFVSSASSDHDYTISEEEREQMREARVYCANLRAKLRSSFCGKQEEPMYEQRKHPARKGKEKIEDMKDEVGKQVCGICLSEEAKRTVRGVLNCCRHYFCFSCIMEWSKVESRCPLCKQRFATITKAAKSDTGFDLRTVVIPVPECDQVYQPSEEELRGYLDPYESVICTECHHGGEDALMLLCDICDSPAHTFCVGLGREVPEGNWYCEGCRPTVFGSLNSQRPTPTPDRRSSNNPSDLLSPIAGGFDLNELYVPETPLTEQTRVPPEPIHAGTVATTLRDRRRIHRQIHHRFLNNNRMSDFVARSSGTSASSSGVRLFGSQLDQTRDSTPQREDQFDAQVQNSSELGGSGMGFDSRLGYAQLQPCTNRSSIGSDASRLHMRAGRLQ